MTDTDAQALLFEIGCEELPASFVDGALEALPGLARERLEKLRLDHGAVRALGTPRRLTLVVEGLAGRQADLREEVTGPPVKVAFQGGAPTKAAEAFAKKLGVAVDALSRVDTPKGEYLAGVLEQEGQATAALLPEMLAELVRAIPFRKSMRWGTGELTFGRPIRWLCALFGDEVVELSLEGLTAGKTTLGHRFRHPEPIEVDGPEAYVAALREAHVLVDPAERRRTMTERLERAAAEAGGTLIEDAFLLGENASLVEDPQVVVGSFDESFLALPEAVILEVARGHQRYFGLRGPDGALLPRYLAVVNTALEPANIILGNDRVMKARLADAKFFYDEDLARPLGARRDDLAGIVFQSELGTVLDKVRRLEALVPALGPLVGADEATVEAATAAAGLCKCDLVTWMVGEFPELQGEVGQAYLLAQEGDPTVAAAVAEHYAPKGASDDVAAGPAGALLALADRLDTLVGCFGIGLSPTGGADPFGLRRACIGVLRTCLDKDLDLSVEAAVRAARGAYGDAAVPWKLDPDALVGKLATFFTDRLRGLLAADIASDAVEAALGVAADRPVDARARARALEELAPDTRAKLGEVFKRATNIAGKADEAGRALGKGELVGDEPAERALHERFYAIEEALQSLTAEGRYGEALAQLSTLADPLEVYFTDILVVAEDEAVRRRRLRMMQVISEACASIAQLELLGSR